MSIPKIFKRSMAPLIRPTAKPQPSEMATVAMGLIGICQNSIPSPAAVVATLRCALDLYVHNLTSKGFDPQVVVECQNLGEKLADTMYSSDQHLIMPNDEVAQPSAPPLLGPDGQPLF